jgi:hypothetical protein
VLGATIVNSGNGVGPSNATIWREHQPAPHYQRYHQSEDKTANMGPPCNILAWLGGGYMVNLEKKPKPQNQNSRKRNGHQKERQDPNAGTGKQHDVSRKYAGNRTRCANERAVGIRHHDNMGQPPNHTAEEKEYRKPHIAVSIFDIIGEHPHEQQVTNQMQPSSMKEEVGDQGEGFGDRIACCQRVQQLHRVEAKITFGTGQHKIGAQRAGIEKNQDIQDDDRKRHILKADYSQRRIIMKGQEHPCSLADQQFICEIEHDCRNEKIDAAPNQWF